MTDVDGSVRYVLKEEVAIEDFDDGSLVLLFEEPRVVQLETVAKSFHVEISSTLSTNPRVVELNLVARNILARLDGERTVRHVYEQVARDYERPLDEVLIDVTELLKNLEKEGVIRRIVESSRERLEKMSDTKYLANPDVSCREEDPEGAILYNPDTDTVRVINPTGLMIWQALAQPHTTDNIVSYLLEVCEDVPTNQVAMDVNGFIEALQSGGFIGEVLENDNK